MLIRCCTNSLTYCLFKVFKITYVVVQVHKGVYGFISSTIGHRISGAEITVEGIQFTVKTAKDGDYWRILLPGRYNITVSARGYESYTFEIV